MRRIAIGLTDHLEGPPDQPSVAVYEEVADLVRLADQLGVEYAWFAEHHAHAHHGHLPAPLLFALHLSSRTLAIRLGTAVICLNLHHPLAIAEQVAIADVLTGGRLAPGFGSGSTPEEFCLFALRETDERERHERFEESLRVILAAWQGGAFEAARYFAIPPHHSLPAPAPDLARRCWIAVNSCASARIAGALGFNIMFSHLRTPEQYRDYRATYFAAGGRGLVAANRPVYVGSNDNSAWTQVEPALRVLWKRFRDEGKIRADATEPKDLAELCAHPINFIVGGADSVARQLGELQADAPFDVANVEVRWAGLPSDLVRDSLRRLMEEVVPRIHVEAPSIGQT